MSLTSVARCLFPRRGSEAALFLLFLPSASGDERNAWKRGERPGWLPLPEAGTSGGAVPCHDGVVAVAGVGGLGEGRMGLSCVPVAGLVVSSLCLRC